MPFAIRKKDTESYFINAEMFGRPPNCSYHVGEWDHDFEIPDRDVVDSLKIWQQQGGSRPNFSSHINAEIREAAERYMSIVDDYQKKLSEKNDKHGAGPWTDLNECKLYDAREAASAAIPGICYQYGLTDSEVEIAFIWVDFEKRERTVKWIAKTNRVKSKAYKKWCNSRWNWRN